MTSWLWKYSHIKQNKTKKFTVGIKIFKIQLQPPQYILKELTHMAFLLDFNAYNKEEQKTKKEKYS